MIALGRTGIETIDKKLDWEFELKILPYQYPSHQARVGEKSKLERTFSAEIKLWNFLLH